MMLVRSLAAAVLFVPAFPFASEVEGMEVSESIVVEGAALQLNGKGVRVKEVTRQQRIGASANGPLRTITVPVKVYVGALYLPRKMSDAAAVVALDQPKALRIFFLREVDRSTILGMFKVGFESNSKERLDEFLPKLKLLEPALPEQVKKGQVLSITYLPGRGSSFGVEGANQVTVEGKDFADALFRTWLGPSAADEGLLFLKTALLGA
jgi:hypothetical protein